MNNTNYSTIDEEKIWEWLNKSKEEALEPKAEDFDLEDDELMEDQIRKIVSFYKNSKSARVAVSMIEMLETFRHNRFQKLCLEKSKSIKVMARNENTVNKILRNWYKSRNPNIKTEPIWWKLTPDAIVSESTRTRDIPYIIDFAVTVNKAATKLTKTDKYKQMAQDTGCRLKILMISPFESPITFEGAEIEDGYYELLQECILEIFEDLQAEGLAEEYKKLRQDFKPTMDRDTTIPSEFNILDYVRTSPIVETDQLTKDIEFMAVNNPVFKETTEISILNGFDKAQGSILESYTKGEKNNSLNFLFSTMGISEGRMEQDQISNWLDALMQCGSQWSQLSDNIRASVKLVKNEYSECSNLFQMAKVKGFWNRTDITEVKIRKRMEEGNKIWSWFPLTDESDLACEACEIELNKMKMKSSVRFPIRIETDESMSEPVLNASNYANELIDACNGTVSAAMCRFASAMGQKMLHIKKDKQWVPELWTGGFSSNCFIKLPCDLPRTDSSTIPFISMSLIKADDVNELTLIKMTDIMDKKEVVIDEKKYVIIMSKPQRLFLRQVEQWINADLEYLNLVSSISKNNYLESDKEIDKECLPYCAMFCLNQHLSLSYLLEVIKNLGQSAMSKYSGIEEFIADKFSMPIKSSFELHLWEKSMNWAIDVFKVKNSLQQVIVVEEDSGTISRSSTGSHYPSFFSSIKYEAPEMMDQITAPFMMRKKNQHDNVQGLMGLYADLIKLQEDDQKDQHVNVKKMSSKSRYCYDRRYIVAATLFSKRTVYDNNKETILSNIAQSGIFDSHGLLATNRGSRKVEITDDGYLIASTNIAESLERETIHRVIDVAKDAIGTKPFFEVAQKEQKGKDRGICITTFPMRCLLKCSEEIAKAHSKLLDNEAMNKGGELKSKIVQQKINELVKGDITNLRNETETILFLSADNTKHSEHDSNEKYKISWGLHDHIDPRLAAIPQNVQMMLGNKRFYLPRRLEKHIKRMNENPFEENKVIKEKLSGKTYFESYKGWPQGMSNNMSTKIHAEAQRYAIEKIKQIMARPVSFVGGVHSDDSWCAIKIPVMKGEKIHELHLQAMNIYYYCILASGFRLNLKKTVGDTEFCEFLSTGTFIGDQTSVPVKAEISIISPLPCRGPAKDMPAGLSQVQNALRKGMPMIKYMLKAKLVQTQVKRLYSMGKGQVNDPTLNIDCKERMLPLQFGGLCNSPPLSLMLWGPRCHNLFLLESYDHMSLDEKRMLNAALPQFKGDFNTILNDVGRHIDGGWRGPTNSPSEKKSIQRVRERFGEEESQMAKDLIDKHPVLKFDKPRQHSMLMIFLRALILDPDFAMGIAGTSGMQTWLRIAKSVRGKVWIWSKNEDKVTLREWFNKAQKVVLNEELIQQLRECYRKSGSNVILKQEMGVEFKDYSDSVREPKTLAEVRPLPGERNVRLNIGSLLMYYYDRDFYFSDGRVDHYDPQWKSHLEMVEEIARMVHGLVPLDQEIQIVQAIMMQDKTYRIFASLPKHKIITQNDMIRVMYTYNFFIDAVVTIDFNIVPIHEYSSKTFTVNQNMELRRACAHLIGIYKWMISTESNLTKSLNKLTWNVNSEPVDKMKSDSSLIEMGLNSANTTKAMKDDLLIVKKYKEYKHKEFNDEETFFRFGEIENMTIYIERSQARERGGWYGPGKMSVSMKPNLYTSLEYIGSMRRNNVENNIKLARIVTNHKNEAAINLSITQFKRYLSKMDTKMFDKTFSTEAYSGLQLIGEVYTRRDYEEGDGKHNMLIWHYDPSIETSNIKKRVVSFKINKHMNLLGSFAHASKENKIVETTIRKSWTWMHIPTQGCCNWTTHEVIENNVVDINLSMALDIFKIDLNELEKKKGIHQISSSQIMSLAEVSTCMNWLTDENNDIKTMDSIWLYLRKNINTMNERMKMQIVTKNEIVMQAKNELEEISLEEWQRRVEELKEEGEEIALEDMRIDEDEEFDYGSDIGSFVSDESDRVDKPIKFIDFKAGRYFESNLALAILMTIKNATGIRTESEHLKTWSSILISSLIIKSEINKLNNKGIELTEDDMEKYIFEMCLCSYSTTCFSDIEIGIQRFEEFCSKDPLCTVVRGHLKNGENLKAFNTFLRDLARRYDNVSRLISVTTSNTFWNLKEKGEKTEAVDFPF